MSLGGNQRAKQFFKQHGWYEQGADKIEQKVCTAMAARQAPTHPSQYTSRAAQLYKQTLEKEANKLAASGLVPSSPTAAQAELAALSLGDTNGAKPEEAAPEAKAPGSDVHTGRHYNTVHQWCPSPQHARPWLANRASSGKRPPARLAAASVSRSSPPRWTIRCTTRHPRKPRCCLCFRKPKRTPLWHPPPAALPTTPRRRPSR